MRVMARIRRNIHRHAPRLLLGLMLSVASPAAAGVTDVSVEVTQGSKPAALRARVHTPAGEPPFSALVFLHGCAGLGRRQDAWADELVREGYVVLVVDSFGARGLTRACGTRATFPGAERAGDAFAAV